MIFSNLISEKINFFWIRIYYSLSSLIALLILSILHREYFI
jgi:hypothetical protein